MASLGPVQSLQIEHSPTPKIRRDQYKRISSIVRINSQFPEVALGLVRDYIKHAPDVKAILLSDDKTYIRVIMKNDHRLEAEYQFNMIPQILLETPTLR